MSKKSSPTAIRNWQEDDRPREKLVAKGAAALTNAELLAILINSGTAEHSALGLAKKILGLAGNNLVELGRLGISDLVQIRGIGPARAIMLMSALELSRRRRMEDGMDRTTINNGDDATEIVVPLLADFPHEVFCVLYLNQASKLLRHEIISSGGLTGTVADIRLILKQALLLNSNRIIVAHNHPSGNINPSRADKELTKKLRDAAKLMDISLLDHVIVAGNRSLSMVEEGLM